MGQWGNDEMRQWGNDEMGNEEVGKRRDVGMRQLAHSLIALFRHCLIASLPHCLIERMRLLVCVVR